MKNFLLVFIGGGLGSLSRYVLSFVFPADRSQWPWATFLANIIACLLLGFILGLLTDKMPSQQVYRLFWITGFCGGFSTFSTFSVESLQSFQQGNTILSLSYMLLSFIACILFIALGQWLGKFL
ncbi:MAG: fluoride efflux transporter CrcB [Cyclobacteriaceae bacterium]|jgi:CrcB protein|nr:fluoride efflux transporter CrcB [Cyclobacteriaceae bacterium]